MLFIDDLDRLKELVRPYYLKWFYFNLAGGNRPPAFQRWRDYPSASLDASPGSLLPPPSELPDIVFLPMADWHDILQRSQQLARGLAALGHRCIYINPHLGREFPQPSPFSSRRLVTWLEPRILELHVHLTREPVFHHRCLHPGEVEAVASSIVQLLESIQSKQQIVITSFPLWAGVADRLRGRLTCPVVYDCHDLLDGFTNISADILDSEARLLCSADLTVFSSEWLAQESARRHAGIRKSILVRNAVDAGAFEFTGARDPSAPVTIGYAGSINAWFDSAAVSLAAQRHPGWRFLLVGPVAQAFPRQTLSALPNVTFIGEVPHGDLFKWMSQFTVATIPFLIQPLTRATNPIKMYEYFACGLPVVSSRLGEVERYEDLAYIADSPEQFVEQLEQAVAEDDPAKRAARRAVAVLESWAQRCATLSSAALELSADVVNRSRRPTTSEEPERQQAARRIGA